VSDPKEQQEQSDDLDLEAEKVADLELHDEDAEQLKGGQTPPTRSNFAPC